MSKWPMLPRGGGGVKMWWYGLYIYIYMYIYMYYIHMCIYAHMHMYVYNMAKNYFLPDQESQKDYF